MAEIPASAQALLGTDAIAHVWTRNPDGSPQVSVVWVIVQDDQILFGTDGRSVKARNLRNDPSVILSIEDTERNERGFQRHLVIRVRPRSSPSSRPGSSTTCAAGTSGSPTIPSACASPHRRSPSGSTSTGSLGSAPGSRTPWPWADSPRSPAVTGAT